MLTLTLSTLGLPLEGVGLLLAIDPILDMGRTAVNVAGQALVPTIVAKRQGIWTSRSMTMAARISKRSTPRPCRPNRATRFKDTKGRREPPLLFAVGVAFGGGDMSPPTPHAP